MERSEAMQRLISNARDHGFAVPVCGSCGHNFYPPQTWCPRCLSADIGSAVDDGRAVVISCCRVFRSLVQTLENVPPVYIATVKAESGISLFAMTDMELPSGTPVTITLRGDLFHVQSISGAG